MKKFLFKTTRSVVRRFGYDITPRLKDGIPRGIDERDRELIKHVRGYTMTSPARIAVLANAVRYVVQHDVPGAIVECGVWRGGSMMAVARTLLDLGKADRDLYLFDTYEGMPHPTSHDVSQTGDVAWDKFEELKDDRGFADWCRAPLEDVKRVMMSTGYDGKHLHFIQGKVEDTLPDYTPEEIAIARLDTDWYESTHAEMVHLFPRLVKGGVLISDDYFHWRGVRKAIDDYVRQNRVRILFNRIDHAACVAVKQEK